MLRAEDLKDWLHKSSQTRLDQILIVLCADGGEPKKVRQIRQLARDAGLRKIDKWNISSILGKSGGLAVLTAEGWDLTVSGEERIKSLGIDTSVSPVTKVLLHLRSLLEKIHQTHTKSFVLEAVSCAEHKLFRAAVVLSWVGAISVLYSHVVSAKINEFNQEAKKRDVKWKDAKSIDDLARMKEDTFLDVLESISVIGKSVKDALKECLKRRNGCGHPNLFEISESTVAHHLEILLLNVFSKF